MSDIVCVLNITTPVCFIHRTLHTTRDSISVHNYLTINMARCTTNCLDECAFTAEKAFFVGIKNRDQADLWQVKTFAKEVDTHKYIVDAHAKITQDVATL